MNKKIIMIAIVGMLLVTAFAVFYISEPLELVGGVEVYTDTYEYSRKVWLGCPSKEVRVFGHAKGIDNGELFIDKEYPTPWSKFETTAAFDFTGCQWQSSEGWKFPGQDLIPVPWFRWGDMWWEVQIYEEGAWETIIPKSGYPDSMVEIVAGTTGVFGVGKKDDGDCGFFETRCDGGSSWNWYSSDVWAETIPGLVFKIKGPHEGWLRATLWMNHIAWSDDCSDMLDCKDKNCIDKKFKVFEDFTQLVSGEGDVEILPNPLPPGGNIFEEGQTVNFVFDTDYAGESTNPWKVIIQNPLDQPAVGLELRDNAGNAFITDSEGAFHLPNWKQNYDVYWDIPMGTYIPEISTKWLITLYNTFTAEAQEEWFTLYEGAHKHIPGPTTITMISSPKDGEYYRLGETVELKMTAQANPDAPEQFQGIWEFEIWAFYGDKINSVVNHPYTDHSNTVNTEGLTYECDFSFIVGEMAEYLIVEGRAYSGNNAYPDNAGEKNGGLPGLAGRKVFYIPNGGSTHTLEVLVTLDDKPIRGATVELGHLKDITDSYGMAYFDGLSETSYILKASHPDASGSKTRSIKVSGRSEEEINLESGMSINIIIGAILAAVFVIVFVIVAYMLPLSMPFKILVMVVGLAIAIIIFFWFWLSGPL